MKPEGSMVLLSHIEFLSSTYPAVYMNWNNSACQNMGVAPGSLLWLLRVSHRIATRIGSFQDNLTAHQPLLIMLWKQRLLLFTISPQAFSDSWGILHLHMLQIYMEQGCGSNTPPSLLLCIWQPYSRQCMLLYSWVQ